MAGTIDDPEIREEIVKANPDQQINIAWRWGPRWAVGGRRGIWVVQTLGHIALRLEYDETEPEVAFSSFCERLKELIEPDKYATANAKLLAFAGDEPAGELTPNAFARLRSKVVHAERVARSGSRALPLPPSGVIPYLEGLPHPITAHAGDWVQAPGLTSMGVPRKWHRFTGDLGWRAGYGHVNATVDCSVGGVSGRDLNWSEGLPAADACKRCLAKPPRVVREPVTA